MSHFSCAPLFPVPHIFLNAGIKHSLCFIYRHFVHSAKSKNNGITHTNPLAVSLQWLNVQSLRVGQQHQVWKSIPHDVRIVIRAYPKLCLLTGTYILQENRARFNQYSVNDCYLLCGAGAKARTHFIAGCSRLEPIRVIFKEQLTTILSRKNP